MKKLLCIILCLPLFILAQETIKLEKEFADDPIVIIKTNMGDIYVELFEKEAPETVKNFVELAEGLKEYTDAKTQGKLKGNFYDGLIFHRVIKGFMIQGGCPNKNGTGGPGYQFVDEINASSLDLDKEKVIDRETGPSRLLPIRPPADDSKEEMMRYQREFSRIVLMPLVHKLGIKSQKEYVEKQAEVEKELLAMTMKDCYENMGYKYKDDVK